ncbi:hypothetical protein WJR50_33630 [Catalinimonas sp. 4WD22]|uniref:hypothetical protein n=1 Tax=Catalinimonas locisalis TaxID=3133978 RepID=UPI00310109EF
MKRLLSTLVLAFFISASSFAQISKVDFAVDKKDELLDFVSLGKEGFIIKTGTKKTNTKDLNWKLTHFTNDKKQIWQVPLSTFQSERGLGENIVATRTGSYVYHIENIGENWLKGSKEAKLTQISQKGKVRVFDIKEDMFKSMGNLLQAQFVDNEYLYVIKTDESASPTKLLINAFSHDNFSFKQTAVILPNSEANWQFITQNENHIWLASKPYDEKTSNTTTDLIAIDYLGTIQKKLSLNIDLDNRYFSPFVSYSFNPGVKHNQGNETQFYAESSKFSSYSGQGTTYTSFASSYSHGHLIIDEEKNIIIWYGLYNNSASKLDRADAEGYYIYAYNLESKPLWQYVSSEEDLFDQDKIFRRKVGYERPTMAYLTDDSKVSLQFATSDMIQTTKFDLNGKKIAEYSNSNYDKIFSYYDFFSSFSNEKINGFLDEYASGRQLTYLSNKNCNDKLLIEFKRGERISLLSW